MIILGIETSCDETAAAILKSQNGRIQILSNVVASSANLQSKYGGIIPEQAAREQVKSIIPVIHEALIQSNLYTPSSKSHLPSSIIYRPNIDAIAVTFGPGLIGSLLVGVETAKVLSVIWQKPLIPINHLLGHFYANWIDDRISNIVYGISENKETDKRLTINDKPSFPCIGLLVSGGHTDLVLFQDHGKYEYLGGTRDDAAGECFDKCARLLGLPYPGGPEISKLAKKGDSKAFKLPRPMIDTEDFDFSYSGLKTSVSNIVYSIPENIDEQSSSTNKRLTINDKQNLAASIEQAIIDPLVYKTIKAAKTYKVKTIILGGGVAANEKLHSELQLAARRYLLDAEIFVPQKFLCTDNGAMIAAAAFFEKPFKNSLKLQANPNLSLHSDTLD